MPGGADRVLGPARTTAKRAARRAEYECHRVRERPHRRGWRNARRMRRRGRAGLYRRGKPCDPCVRSRLRPCGAEGRPRSPCCHRPRVASLSWPRREPTFSSPHHTSCQTALLVATGSRRPRTFTNGDHPGHSAKVRRGYCRMPEPTRSRIMIFCQIFPDRPSVSAWMPLTESATTGSLNA